MIASVASASTLITAFAGLLVAVSSLGTLALLVITYRNSRVTKANGNAIAKVEVLVDGRMTAMEERVAQLTAALESSNTDVPPVPDPRAA